MTHYLLSSNIIYLSQLSTHHFIWITAFEAFSEILSSHAVNHFYFFLNKQLSDQLINLIRQKRRVIYVGYDIEIDVQSSISLMRLNAAVYSESNPDIVWPQKGH